MIEMENANEGENEAQVWNYTRNLQGIHKTAEFLTFFINKRYLHLLKSHIPFTVGRTLKEYI